MPAWAAPRWRHRLKLVLRRLALALPVSAATRQRIKVGLASQAWGSPLLRWLAPAPAQDAGPAPVDKEVVRAAAEAALTEFLAAGHRVALPSFGDAPRVTVIIVLFNQAGLSLQCLQALARTRGVAFETLIVDNASSDRVPQLLERVDGAQVSVQLQNLGFLRAVNLAAEQARGDALLLLNNDALVEPDTLARALARLDSDARTAAVGGPILLWDGRLQEAGSIVWRDGSCSGYGRGASPESGPYRFVREVDYCSGALLLLRRALFDRLGRFDEAFAPAYYEESDFCARLWQAGHAVVYDPQVRVKHFEFASDSGSGQALALQARNRLRFVARHREFLAGQPDRASAAAQLVARQRLRPGARRVLFIDDRVPLPWLGKGYPRAAAFVAALAAAGDAVTHYPLQSPFGDWQEVYRVLPDTVEVMLGEGLAGVADFLTARAGFYGLVIISRPHNMEVIQALRDKHPQCLAGARIVYDAEALFSLRDIARAELSGKPLPAAQRRRLHRRGVRGRSRPLPASRFRRRAGAGPCDDAAGRRARQRRAQGVPVRRRGA